MILFVVVATSFISQALGEATQVVTSKTSEYSMVEEDDWSIGELNEIQSHPWIGSIQNGDQHVCAGSVISPNIVLTAAGCVAKHDDPTKLTVRLGCSIAQRGGSVHQVVQLRRHEGYKNGSAANDVALLKLSPPIEFGRDVKTIGYANRGDSLGANSSASVTGWTAEAHRVGSMLLRSAELRVLDKSRCANLTGDEHICVGNPQGSRGPVCQGDPGGPLVADQLQFGIVPSTGLGCVSSGRPGLVTNLARHRLWIDANVLILNANKPKSTFTEFMETFILPMFWPFNQL